MIRGNVRKNAHFNKANYKKSSRPLHIQIYRNIKKWHDLCTHRLEKPSNSCEVDQLDKKFKTNLRMACNDNNNGTFFKSRESKSIFH